jgi:hypothetical protein
MAEAARLYGLLQASAARNAYQNKALEYDYSPYASSRKRSKAATTPAPRQAIPCSLLEVVTHATQNGVTPAQSISSLSTEEVHLYRVLNLLNESISRDENLVSGTQVKDNTKDLDELKFLTHSFSVSIPSLAMAGRLPVLSTSSLPQATPEEQSATASPARGTAMLNSIFKSVRVPEFRHKWMFWAEKGQQATPKDKSASSEEYASRPKPLGDQIISVKEFYQHFNNIPVESLKLRDSLHLFHMGIKPVWEDPRNTRGGAWYFKIPKDVAAQFWHEMCLLAVGDGLQGAVETKRACKSSPSLFYSIH